ncbi:helix-turn-helix transcriptional regulator [Halocella sp. SP3-1]|uniref:helix-turn-helix domain-containing protein n=1 Tax=Halocella sp. SP3-1 TaxID=2382161 RepID=UPI000F74F549|nr:helix-turn-helix transcriptional regulator [Halocella sp. SP3-1]AZO94324.1 XRE family transcriptional regulator [Halocella sp. SP3-1]
MINIKINNILNDKGKSIYWLADKTGLAYSTTYNLVNNNTASIHFKTLEEIMQALDITDFNQVLEIIPEE